MNCVVIFQFNVDVLVFAMCRKSGKGSGYKCVQMRSSTRAQKSEERCRSFRPLVIFGLWEVDAYVLKGHKVGADISAIDSHVMLII